MDFDLVGVFRIYLLAGRLLFDDVFFCVFPAVAHFFAGVEDGVRVEDVFGFCKEVVDFLSVHVY